MKKFLMFLLLAITLVLGSCSNKEEAASKTSIDTESAEKQDTTTLNESEEIVSQKDQEATISETSTDTESSEKQETSKLNNVEETLSQKELEETTDAPDFFDIYLNTESGKVELLYPGGKSVVLADNTPSDPLKSPNGEKAAYFSPWGWEEMSNLYIVDLQDGSQDILVPFEPENKPKDVIWEDDEHVLVIIGFPYGTISVGGDIYRINVETAEKELVIDFDDNIQITDLLHIEDGVLYYSGIQYTDEKQNDYKDYFNHIKLESE